MSFTCPRCGATSHHPMDELHGYCGACHDFTGGASETRCPHCRRDDGSHDDWCRYAPPHDIAGRQAHANGYAAGLKAARAITERLDRVDYALARQLSESMQYNARLHREIAEARDQIERWSQAYPLSVFPEPDLDKAAELLKAGGLTLDAVSANMARHVLSQVTKIVQGIGKA